MLTSLDLLVIAVMILAALSLLGILVMFLVKNKLVRKIAISLAAAVSLCITVMGLYIFGVTYAGQAVISLLMGTVSVASVVLLFVADKKENDKLSLVARIAAAAALVLGAINVF